MSKLDYDLLQQVESHINPCKERELDLRGLKIQRIENLILTKDQHDCLDFTDNDIQILGNFSFMPNLKTLLVANNRIQKIENDIAKYIPNLKGI
jgi:U2 small nuclear ribonucleoprotein A'